MTKRGKFINVIKSFCSIVRSLHWLAVLWEGYTFITMCNHGKDYPNSLLYSDIAFIYPFHFKGLMRVLVSCTTFLYWLNSHNAKIFVLRINASRFACFFLNNTIQKTILSLKNYHVYEQSRLKKKSESAFQIPTTFLR